MQWRESLLVVRPFFLFFYNIFFVKSLNDWIIKNIYTYRLQEEVDDVVGEKPVIDFSDLQKLPYLDMVLKETLRLYPPVTGATRESAFDVTINGIHIPKGTKTIVSMSL